MSSIRDRTLVVDFGVLPDRPKLDIVQRFIEKGMGLDPVHLRSIQLHNIRHCVLIEMANPAAAAETAQQHHLKHAFRINETTKIAIPVYVDDNTIDVRVHDLPRDLKNLKIAEAMREYGEVLTIRDEVWRNFFAGVPNGVRVLKMKLSKPIPSFITICNFTTLATHTGQLITCRQCGAKRHPGKSCSEAAKSQKLPKSNKNPPAPILPLTNPAVVEAQVIAPNSEDNDDGFTTVGRKGKTKRQLSTDDDETSTISTIFDDDHCNNEGQPMDLQIKSKPKRRLPSAYQLT